MKRLLGALLALLLLLPLALLPAPARAEDGAARDETPEIVPGVIPEAYEYDYPTPRQALAFRTADGPNVSTSLPARYDGRGEQTGVKDQGGNGMCWSFAAYGALEANMKKNGMGERDFSELHMGYATSTYYYDKKVVNEKCGYKTSDKALLNTISEGGNRTIAAAYLMRGELGGALNEADDPYESTIVKMRDPAITESKKSSWTARNILFLSGKDKATAAEAETIKSEVMRCGAVAASMYWRNDAYNEETASYCLNRVALAGHMVLIVGWDDGYDRRNFKEPPENNGAWLVKNSYGETWGDNGYFWISYEDISFPMSALAFDGGAEAWNAKTQYVYESDYKPNGNAAGASSGTATFVKVFPIDAAARTVTSVRVFLPSGGSVRADVDVIPAFAGFEGYTFSALGTCRAAYPGWYTVELNAPAELPASGSFAVVVRLSGASKLCCDQDTALGAAQAYFRKGSGDFESSKYNWCIKAVCDRGKVSPPAVSGTLLGDGKLRYAVTAAPKGALLIAARYEGGRMTDVQTVSVSGAAAGILQMRGSGGEYRLMLVSGTAHAPLCDAWSSE